MNWLVPLPATVPLAVAGALLVLGKMLPSRVPDAVAIGTAMAAAAACIAMASATGLHPLVSWFGGWEPRGEVSLGISFVVDRASAVAAAFVAFLFVAALVFAWGYYDEVHAHFHVLMMLFMAGMVGFCLTHDVFNMFVWFEVMSVAGYAVTGYALRVSSLDAALNFTVVNTIGSYLFLGGIGLAYAATGSLDFTAIGRGVAAAPADPVIVASFCLIAVGLLVKAAQVPFQFWLADAHSVAPSPVSVIFSGAMVGLGLFGLAKLTWQIYAPSTEILLVVHRLLLGMGVASVIVGGLMSLVQRHVKRLLAFSTISHLGIAVIGFATLDRAGLGGMLDYLLGHGLVKASLFMIAGIILACCGGIDETRLRGAGRGIWPVGLVMAAGGLMLAGLPVGTMQSGAALIDHAARAGAWDWVAYPINLANACTGAAVLRASGRIFRGWGRELGQEGRESTDEEQEKRDRPLWLMLAPCVLVLLLGVIALPGAREFALEAAGVMTGERIGLARPAPEEAISGLLPWVAVLLAVLIAAFELARAHLPRWLTALSDRVTSPPFRALQVLHGGLVPDYVTWLAVGLACFAATCAFG